MEGQKHPLKPEDYLDLWKKFEEDADKAKDKLWTITSWLYALMGGLMVFLLDRENPTKILILFGSGIGILLSFHTGYMTKEFGNHIKNYWERANTIRKTKIEGFSEILKPKNDDKNEVPFPRFAQRLMFLAICYGLAFVLLALNLMLLPPINPS